MCQLKYLQVSNVIQYIQIFSNSDVSRLSGEDISGVVLYKYINRVAQAGLETGILLP